MKKINKYLLFIVFVISNVKIFADTELVYEQNVPIIVDQVIKGFFANTYYPEKEICRRGAEYEAKKKCVIAGSNRLTRECVKARAIERINFNIKSYCMERAREYVRGRWDADNIVENVSREIMNDLNQVTDNGYQGAFSRLIRGHRDLDSKIKTMVNYYSQPKLVCSLDSDHTEGVKKLQCGHAICIDCLLRWNDSCQSSGRKTTCPLCQAVISTTQLQTIINNYYDSY